jgi:adenine-specific DNA-methyltransferase
VQEGKLNLESVDIAAEKQAELLRLFPETATEGGKIDFDQLKRALGEIVDPGKERYGMSWPGKAECFRAIQSPSIATLLPVREESVRFDETENMIIEGDNLEVLKLLQKGYQGKVKMIYIDPPYNTGNDFIYPDNYSESLQTYLEYTGQVDAGGRRFSNNLETDGRFHSKWLNMMYPRLYLARNLLRDDGLIFVSVGDNEVASLRALMNTCFGEDNFVAQFVWQKKTGGGAKSQGVIGLHEYILSYARTITPDWDLVTGLSDKMRTMYNKRDEYFDTLGPYATWPLDTTSMGERKNLRFAILHDGHEIWPEKQWLWSLERVREAQSRNGLVFRFDETKKKWSVRFKGYLRDENGTERSGKPTSLFIGPYTQQGTADFQAEFDRDLFPFPKPVQLITSLVQMNVEGAFTKSQDRDIVLDFFAGSGTTGESILKLRNGENCNLQFILVQLPEPTRTQKDDGTFEESEAWKAGYKTIADITKERVRRVIQRQEKEAEGKLDLQTEGQSPRKEGFRVFKLAPSNFKVWDAHTDGGVEALEHQLELAVHNVRQDRTSEDLLYEILLKSEFPLTAPVTRFDAAGIEAFSVQQDDMIVCVAQEVTEAAITAIAARKPLQVVFLDEAFSGNDQLKKNARLNFEAAGVTRFQTI